MSTETQWVTFRVARETFAFAVQHVKEMLRLPEVHAVPQASPDNLGVILLRSEVIPVFDLRRKFGLQSLTDTADELVTLLRARLQDHENWLAELRRSIAEQREFSLTTDPHKCKFGMWYDTFETDDPWLARLLRRFDEPHRRIHQVGEAVLAFQHAQQYDKAHEAARSTAGLFLADLKRLFGETINHITEQSRPSLMVVATSSATLGVAVDEIQAVVRCHAEEIQPPDSIPGSEDFGGLVGLLPIKGSQKFVMLLDPAQLYPQLANPLPEVIP
ncbi:MAG TPA: chemotaxis protein CheW [bacterium]|jgi:purine-binding chemotaxis protein CheW